METDYIKCCNCLDGMKDLPNDSIDLVVTSPPYDDLRSYNGYSFEFEEWCEALRQALTVSIENS